MSEGKDQFKEFMDSPLARKIVAEMESVTLSEDESDRIGDIILESNDSAARFVGWAMQESRKSPELTTIIRAFCRSHAIPPYGRP